MKQLRHVGELQPWRACLRAPARLSRIDVWRMCCMTWGVLRRLLARHPNRKQAQTSYSQAVAAMRVAVVASVVDKGVDSQPARCLRLPACLSKVCQLWCSGPRQCNPVPVMVSTSRRPVQSSQVHVCWHAARSRAHARPAADCRARARSTARGRRRHKCPRTARACAAALPT